MRTGTITETETNNPAEVEAKTNPELTAELEGLRAALREVKVRLWGDEELYEKWRKAKATYVTPNIPEPPPGELQELHAEIAGIKLDGATDATTRRLDAIEKHMHFVDRVGAWIGSLMDSSEFQPPLNGEQIASKRYVDDAVARLSAALRGEWNEPLHYFKQLYNTFAQFIDIAAVDHRMQPVDKARHRLAVIDEIVARIVASWKFTASKRAEESKPGPLQRLKIAAKFIASGSPTNGGAR